MTDLGKLKGGLIAGRAPFLSPDAFAEKVRAGVEAGTLGFTAGKVDEDFVIGKYRDGFVAAFNNHTRLQNNGVCIHLNDLGWGDEEGRVLVEVRACPGRVLGVCGAACAGSYVTYLLPPCVCAQALKYAVQHCSPEEIELNFLGNKWSEETSTAIKQAVQGSKFDVRIGI